MNLTSSLSFLSGAKNCVKSYISSAFGDLMTFFMGQRIRDRHASNKRACPLLAESALVCQSTKCNLLCTVPMAKPLFPSAAVITDSTHEGNVKNGLLLDL